MNLPECCNQAGECQIIATGDLDNVNLHYDTNEMYGLVEVTIRCHICGSMDVWIE
jgi:hypothetical protein